MGDAPRGAARSVDRKACRPAIEARKLYLSSRYGKDSPLCAAAHNGHHPPYRITRSGQPTQTRLAELLWSAKADSSISCCFSVGPGPLPRLAPPTLTYEPGLILADGDFVIVHELSKLGRVRTGDSGKDWAADNRSCLVMAGRSQRTIGTRKCCSSSPKVIGSSRTTGAGTAVRRK